MVEKHREPGTVNQRLQEQSPAPSLDDDVNQLVGDYEYEAAFGEALRQTLDLDTWATGSDWEAAVTRLNAEIRAAAHREGALLRRIREELLPRIGKRCDAPEAGVHRTTPDEIAKVHEGLLFPGGVEAVRGTTVSHDTLPLGITQIGVAIVSYGGASATFAQRVYRKEIAERAIDPFEAACEVIDRRDARSIQGQPDRMSELVRRGITTYAERKLLLDKGRAGWRLGYRAPFPYELLTGSGSMRFLDASLDVLGRLVEYERFVFVANDLRERALLTLGHALAAGEYAVVGTIQHRIDPDVRRAHYARRKQEDALSFVRRYGPDVVYGLYRASEQSPPCVFYAHRKHVHIAARIAIADSVLCATRGFPMLLDVAGTTCESAFGAAGFLGLVQSAYSHAGLPLRYYGERQTRG